ncbi:MAG: hypothetical protein KF760_13185 [Candidatus Eremiobacteraeota bacterium]|nr:hypothetical protein [Candidatus Eremiobacteraeota bacterium]
MPARGVGWGFSFESTLPALRIDYIWHSPQWHCSDHLPLYAVFDLR